MKSGTCCVTSFGKAVCRVEARRFRRRKTYIAIKQLFFASVSLETKL